MSTLAASGLAASGIAGALALAGLSAASADGVVIESSSSSHAVGERVEAGSFVAVEEGASVTVLDRSGRVSVFSGPGGRSEEPDAGGSDAQAGPSAASQLAMSLTNLGRRAGLGTTRGPEAECEAVAGDRSVPSPDCAAAGLAFSVRAGVTGYLTCDVAEAGGAWRRLDLGGGHGGAAVEAGRDYAFPPADGGASLELGSDVRASVRCQAVDAAAWALLEPSWRDDFTADEARALLRGVAEVTGGVFLDAIALQ